MVAVRKESKLQKRLQSVRSKEKALKTPLRSRTPLIESSFVAALLSSRLEGSSSVVFVKDSETKTIAV